MAEFVTGFQTKDGIKKYDYHSLGNKPESFSNALKNSVSGKIVRVDDVSPVEHDVKCKARGKNLIPYPFVDTTIQRTGLTFTDNGDGSINVKGTVSGGFAVFVLQNNIELSDGITYFVNGANVYLAYKDGTGATKYAYNTALTWSKEYTFVRLYVQYSDGAVVDTIVRPTLSIDTAIEFVPYVNPLNVSVKICGKNLIPLKAAVSGTTQGLNYTNNGNGVITINGTAKSSAYVPVETNLYLPAGQYILSQQGDEISPSYLYITGATGYNPVTNNGSKVVTSTGGICQIYVYVATDTVVEHKTVKVMLEAGEIKSSFEHPIEAQIATASSDGTVEGVKSVSPTMTFITDTENIMLEVEYQRDIDKAFKEIEQILSSARIVYINILASAWKGSDSLYSQVVTVPGVTKNSQVDLTPSIDQLVIFYNKNLTFVTENVNGVVTVYAIGQKPQNDYTIQATVTEVRI